MGTFCNTTGNWGFGLGGLITLLFWGVVIWAIIYLVKNLSAENSVNFKNKKALNILEERYAKGELSKEDFQRMKKELE